MKIRRRIKQVLRIALGDSIATCLHAARFWYLRQRHKRELETLLIPWLLQEGDVAIDVGANGADWTLPLSKQVGPRGRVYAFEADPYYAEATRKAIALLRLRNVSFFSFGLSDKSETAHLLVYSPSEGRLSGTSRIVCGGLCPSDHGITEVRMESLDGLAGVYPDLTSARLIKCDVEGYELKVFRGARGVLERARPIIIAEVGHAQWQGFCEDDLCDYFHDLEYESYAVIDPRRPSLRRCSRLLSCSCPQLSPNRIMIPKSVS